MHWQAFGGHFALDAAGYMPSGVVGFGADFVLAQGCAGGVFAYGHVVAFQQFAVLVQKQLKLGDVNHHLLAFGRRGEIGQRRIGPSRGAEQAQSPAMQYCLFHDFA